MTLTTDDLAPRDLSERWRVYALRPDGELCLLSTTPDDGGIGVAIVTHAAEGNLTPFDRLGVMDTCPQGEPAERGVWLASPYA